MAASLAVSGAAASGEGAAAAEGGVYSFGSGGGFTAADCDKLLKVWQLNL